MPRLPVVDYLFDVARASGWQIFLVIATWVVLVLITNVASAAMNLVAVRALGVRAHLWAVIMPGVILHELAHVLACWVFGHKVTKAVLFDPKMRSGSAGYVEHAWNTRNPWSQLGVFFIGLAPVLLSLGLVIALMAWAGGGAVFSSIVVPDPSEDAFGALKSVLLGSVTLVWDLVEFGLSEEANGWRWLLVVYLGLVSTATVRLSGADLGLIRRGAAYALTWIVIFNLAVYWTGYWTQDLEDALMNMQVKLLAACQLVVAVKLLGTGVLLPLALGRRKPLPSNNEYPTPPPQA